MIRWSPALPSPVSPVLPSLEFPALPSPQSPALPSLESMAMSSPQSPALMLYTPPIDTAALVSNLPSCRTYTSAPPALHFPSRPARHHHGLLPDGRH